MIVAHGYVTYSCGATSLPDPGALTGAVQAPLPANLKPNPGNNSELLVGGLSSPTNTKGANLHMGNAPQPPLSLIPPLPPATQRSNGNPTPHVAWHP